MAEAARHALAAAALLAILLSAAGMLIWVERRLLGAMQNRCGPNRVGPAGLLQTAADIVKILTKEDWVPPFAHRPLFILAPTIVLVTALLAFAVIPFAPHLQLVDPDVGVLFFLAMSAVGVYSVVLAGWSSNGKYSLLGGLRAAAQILAYEVFMGLSLMGVVILAGSFRIGDIVAAQEGLWFCVPQALGLAVFLVAGVAETHRLPLDMPEAESELVAGYHSEYSGMKFGMFFLGEYLGVLLVSAFVVTLFFGGWRGPFLPPLVWFLLKTSLLVFLFVLLRGSLPRPRYDQFIALGWRVLLPLALLNLMGTAAWVLARGG